RISSPRCPPPTETYALSLHDALPILRVESERGGGPYDIDHLLRQGSAIDDDARRFQDVGSGLSHGQLPRVELPPLAAHRDEHQQREAARTDQSERVHDVADAARLHERNGFLAAEPGAGAHPDGFELVGKR